MFLPQMLLQTDHKVNFTQTKETGVCLCSHAGPVFICTRNKRNSCRRESCDEVVSLRWSHPAASVSLTVQLPLHKEVALLFEVDVAVGAHEAARVVVFVPRFHHCPPAAGRTDRGRRSQEKRHCFDVWCLKWAKKHV